MRTIVLTRGTIVVLAALAIGVPAAAQVEQRRSSSFHGIDSRKKAESGTLRTPAYTLAKNRGDDRKSVCFDARFKAASAALELAERAQHLRMCAAAGDLTEGCSVEYERVRTAHESFESAVVSAAGCG